MIFKLKHTEFKIQEIFLLRIANLINKLVLCTHLFIRFENLLGNVSCILNSGYINLYILPRMTVCCVQNIYDDALFQYFLFLFQSLYLGPKVIKLFSCSTQLSMKFSLLINMKMPTIVGIFIFVSRENLMLSYV